MPQVSLVSLDHLQEFLEVEDTEEGLVNMLAFSATAEIENFTKRVLCKREIIEFHDGYNQNSLELREYPIESITSFCIRRNCQPPDFIPVYTDSYSYEINPEGPTEIRLLLYYSFPRGTKNIKAIYTAGYSEETLPDDLMMACCETVSWLYKRLKARQIGVTHLVDDRNRAVMSAYDNTLPDHVKEILQPYRKKGW